MVARGSDDENTWQATNARPFQVALLLVLIAIIALTALRPGDAQFANDEPETVARALSALDAGRLADDGPIGLLGQEYGPVNTQFMQLLLLLGGRDLIATMAWRIVLYMTILSAALLWLSRAARVSPWFIPVLLVAPPIWYHARLLWDNPWLLPLGVLFLAGYAQLMHGNRKPAPFVMGLSGGLMLLTHPMSAAVPIGVAFHALLTQRAALRRSLVFIMLGGLISVSTSLGYLQRNAAHQITRFAMFLGADRPSLPPPAIDRPPDVTPPNADALPSRPAAGLDAWRGTILFSCEHRIAAPGMDSTSARILNLLRWPAAFGAIIFATGILAALLRRKLDPIQQSLALASLAVLVTQTLIFAKARPTPLPHYQFGASAATLLLCWIGANLLMKHLAARFAITLYGLSLVACTIIVAQSLHRNQGTRQGYGPALNQLVQTAQRAADAGCTEIWTDVPHLVRFPGGIVVPYLQRRPRLRSSVGIVTFATTDQSDASLTFHAAREPLSQNFRLIWRGP